MSIFLKQELYVPDLIDNEHEAALYVMIAKRIPNKFGKIKIRARDEQSFIGNQYAKHRDSLVTKDLIRVRYSYANFPGKHFPMASEFVPYSKFHFVDIKTAGIRKKCFARFSGSDNRLCRKVADCIAELTINTDGVDLPPTASLTAGMVNAGCLGTAFPGRVTQDKFAGRIHSCVSGLHRPLRLLLRRDGEELVQVDAHASQALLLASLAKDRETVKTCERGEFWKRLQEGYRSMTKDDIKTQTYRQFYGGKSTILDDHYPEVARWSKQFNGRELCKRAQQLEKSIFIDGVLQTMYRSKMFAVPIHDCILCRKPDVPYVSDLIKDQWKTKANCIPCLS
jgi:hypothetical protein